METLGRMCLGIDLARPSQAALQSAAVLARRYGAQIDLVHVVAPPPFYAKIVTPIQSRLAREEELIAKANEKLAEMSRGAPLSGLAVACHARSGTPFAELVSLARENGDELIVVGGHAAGGSLLGSTAERVLRKALLPVFVAKAPLDDVPTTILAPTDFSPASTEALKQAVVLARQWGARLILAHVIEPVVHTASWEADVGGTELFLAEPDDVEPEWQELVSGLDLSNVRWEQVTTQGLAPSELSELASQRNVDLIVMGTHGRSALPHALLGSVAESVARRAACSVLTVRPEAHTFTLP